MPVSREDMVSSKYIMLILLTLFGTVFSSIVTMGINIALKSDSLFTSVSNAFVGAFVVIILYSFVFPFIIKLGVEKARIIFFVSIIIPFVVVSSISTFMKEETSEIPRGLVSVMDFLSHYSGIVLPITALAALYLSYRISVKRYTARRTFICCLVSSD
jgi:ABC-type transport system involved in multi-copper enzyme maturation permease subunit